jgi:outer membrane protein, adhesin transport system
MRYKSQTILAAIALLISGLNSSAQPADHMKAAVEKAVMTNPEVLARFNAYKASADAVNVARGGLLPKVDVNGNLGREYDRVKNRTPQSRQFNTTGIGLSVTQLLWDGLSTFRETDRFNHEKLARYYEFLDVAEQTALEAGRAYVDVVRFRRLVGLAEDNYIQHKYASQQIQSRVGAGVGRGVDLEQANARLALAESNLNTETANLHDVSARYLRIVGEPAPADLSKNLALLDKALPANSEETLNAAVSRSAAVSASIEMLRAARSAASVSNGAFHPRIEARLRGGGGKNYNSSIDQTRAATAEVVMNWNLFNGGSDLARVKQQANLVSQAADLRDKTCRDTRQTVAIAYNDIRKLTDQLALLDRNSLAIEKARDAYRQQFDIGQRSLLDLLNAENELYTAKRAYTNAEHDRALAYVRTHAGLTQLTSQLGISRPENVEPEINNWSAGDDVPSRCPSQVIATGGNDLDSLNRRVPNSAPQAAPAPVRAAPVAEANTPAAISVRRLNDWVSAWMSKDFTRYMGFYSKAFLSDKGPQSRWVTERRRLVTKKGPINIRIGDIKTTTLSPTKVETAFEQNYDSIDFKDRSLKTLTWELVDGEWLIVKESNR